MTQEKLAKHKDEQVNTSFPILEPTICADWQEPGKGQKLGHLLGFLKVPSCQVSFTCYSTSVTIQRTLCRTYMQRMGLIPSDEETSSTSSVGARFGISNIITKKGMMTMFRFGGSEGGEGGGSAGDDAGVEDSIDQGPWGLAAYAYYWWSGATGQV